MTKETNPEVLKAKAQELLNKAKEIEDKMLVRVGKVVNDYYHKDFEGFEVEKFKEEVKKAMGEEKRGRKKHKGMSF